ncbi:TetR/AcrR family transcriptional regulator [Saccharopolyspora rosea]|uniref:TetR/AcrR family transcriptional regulator n=1 Tax=Saccharopolyspora rosea TaxID=524884 RepID=A0ABW3G3C2_9PSEU|nr:TetR/AcrR family transcriptional regulator [Saccharopolyspora rosea]
MIAGVQPWEEAPEGRVPLPLTPVDAGPAPRADAARNRARLLAAANRLVAEHGAANLTMEAVAAAAEVGKGTVFRRFGDRTGLLLALLDHCEQRFQEQFLAGPPPLGPGAHAWERLEEFGCALLRHEQRHLDLYLASRPDPVRRFTVGAHRLRRSHVALLLRQAGAGGDTELLAESLLASLDTGLVNHLHVQRGMPLDRIETGWRDLVRRVVTG